MYTDFMYDLVSIGSLTIDLYFQGDSLTVRDGRFELAYGGKYFVEHFHESLGGGATNVAIGARKHGLSVALKTTIGDDGFRSMVEAKLQKERVSYLFSHFDTSYRSVSCIILSEKGEKTVINYRTPHQQIFTSEREKSALLKTKAVFLGNLTDTSFTQKVEAMRHFKNAGIMTIGNLGVEDCRRSREQLNELLNHLDVLMVNAYEFAEIVHTKVEKIPFSKNLYHKLNNSNLKLLIITRDKHGSNGYTPDETYYHAAVAPLRIIDTTGAGDGYSAGFISAYLKGATVFEAMESGSIYASKILAKLGAN